MAVQKILEIPNPILRGKTTKITKFDEEVRKLITDLKDTLASAHNPEGAGLSSNQIGIAKRVCVVRNFKDNLQANGVDSVPSFVEKILINPKIVSKSKENNIEWEGCLSVPNQYGRVSRATKIKVAYQDEEGKRMKLSATGFFARVIQHEIDHLDGIVFTDRVKGKLVPESFFLEQE